MRSICVRFESREALVVRVKLPAAWLVFMKGVSAPRQVPPTAAQSCQNVAGMASPVTEYAVPLLVSQTLDELGFLWKFRLSPPQLATGAELQWVFRRAFGPRGGTLAAPLPTAVVPCASALGLAGRLCSRVPLPVLEAELGFAATRRLALLQLQVRGSNRLLAAALDHALQRARSLGLDVVPLKHAALWLAGRVREGERDARDVDLLVHPAGAPALWHSLQRDGYRPFDGETTGPHLPPLLSQSGACIELHDRLWGMNTSWAGGSLPEALVRAGWVRENSPHSRVLVPTRPFLIAHALVHGLVQHLTSPVDYAPVRVIADLIDLEASVAHADEVSRLAAGTLDGASVHAALELTERLARGAALQDLPAAPGKLLAHLVGASLDAPYRRALRARRLWELVQQRQLFPAAKRFFTSRAAFRGPGGSASVTVGGRVHEAWELAQGVFSHAQLRSRRATPTTTSTTPGKSSNVARRND